MSEDKEISPDNYANWFALFHLSQNIGDQKAIHINSVEFGKILNISQQTASRRINALEEIGWIERKIESREQIIRITKKGADVMLDMYKKLKEILDNILIVGLVSTGIGEGHYYVSIKGYFDQFKKKLGFEPYKGTLNLELSDLNKELLRENLKTRIPTIIEGFKNDNSNRTYGAVYCYECFISRLDNQTNKLKAAILDIKRTHHKKNVIEILAEPYLREYFNLKDGDKLRIELYRNSP
jgi:riboflavin kinase